MFKMDVLTSRFDYARINIYMKSKSTEIFFVGLDKSDVLPG